MKVVDLLCFTVFVVFCVVSTASTAMECNPIDRKVLKDSVIFERSNDYFPTEPSETLYCGEAGFSSLYKAAWEDYESSGNWRKSAGVSCWSDRPGEVATIFSCTRKIFVRTVNTEFAFETRSDIRIGLVDEIVDAVTPQLAKGQSISSINFVAVECGGAWSVSEHGLNVGLKYDAGSTGIGSFLVKKSCAPSPCVWTVNTAQVSPGQAIP